ncbi:MAG: hypothetical protein JNM72_25530 [Deltaproteobacteria bacterium]|jgi:hypothetical protein|nr:hypothetical protein [Deltaproteobacteria bacterium]
MRTPRPFVRPPAPLALIVALLVALLAPGAAADDCLIPVEQRGLYRWPRAAADAGLALATLPTAGGAHLWVGAPGDWAGGAEAGAAALLWWPTRLGDGAPQPRAELRGDAEGEWLGAAIEPLPDLDGDGLPEVAIGAPGSGALRLLPGAAWLRAAPAELEAAARKVWLPQGWGAWLWWDGAQLWAGPDGAAGALALSRGALQQALAGGAPMARPGRVRALRPAPDQGTLVSDWDGDGVAEVFFVDPDAEGGARGALVSGRCLARAAGASPAGGAARGRAALEAAGALPAGALGAPGRAVAGAPGGLALGAPDAAAGGAVLLLGAAEPAGQGGAAPPPPGRRVARRRARGGGDGG